ncbi:MAG: class I SAM-dependent methyltransferase [Vulcanimicrobiaceae bacterium]
MHRFMSARFAAAVGRLAGTPPRADEVARMQPMRARARLLLDAQRLHWEREYAVPDRFGREPSAAARAAVAVFERTGVRRVLELGCGNGRDAAFFAARGFEVHALDYAANAVDELMRRARAEGLVPRMQARTHDVRTALPLADASVDAVYAHMLFNMALLDDEIAALLDESHRVLREGGVLVFTVRSTTDPDADCGTALSAFLRDVEGDIIRFFSDACLDAFGARYESVARERFEEGSLPKRLVLETLRKRARVGASKLDARLTLNEC